MLAVIFIPMILDDTTRTETTITGTNIPPKPDDGFASRIVPLPGPPPRTTIEPGNRPSRPAGPERAAESAPAPPLEPRVGRGPVAAEAEAKTETQGTVASAQQPDRVGLAAWIVQLGSFSSLENANALNQSLRQAGYASFVEPLEQGGSKKYRVRVGPELLRSDAQALRDRLKANMNVDGIVQSYP